MSLFPAITIMVNRPAGPGSYVNGHWVPGPTNVLTLQGSVHPASGYKLQALPEGKRDTVGFEIYTDQPLYTSDPETQDAGGPGHVLRLGPPAGQLGQRDCRQRRKPDRPYAGLAV